MKVYYANDTRFHAGSVAVTEAIINRLVAQGHEIMWRSTRPYGPDPAKLKSCDALVVNGEGAFRDELRNWEPGRIEALMDGMAAAKDLGKRVHLINATWCNMLPHWESVLERLDEVSVRETLSAREMRETTAIEPNIYLDASYYAPVHQLPIKGYVGRVVMGKLYPHNFPDLLTENFPHFAKWRHHYLPLLPPGEGLDWAMLVGMLDGAALYITGQHHGVYAACKARVPFVACKSNTWKVEGLFDWAGVEIPIVRRGLDVEHCVEWALSKPPEFEKLWQFMETRPEWPGVVE